MKRSEAIEAIGKVLVFGPQGLSQDKQEKYKDMSLADIILSELEEIGIVQPVYQEEIGSGQLDDEGYEISTVEWVQGWEAE